MKNKNKILFYSYLILYLTLFSLKVFGINYCKWYADYKWFISFCNFTENNIWFKYILKFIVFNIGTNIFLQAVLSIEKYKENKIYILYIACFEIVRMILNSFNNQLLAIIALILDIIFITILAIKKDKRLWKKSLISLGILFLFEVISTATKSMIHSDFDNTITSL